MSQFAARWRKLLNISNTSTALGQTGKETRATEPDSLPQRPKEPPNNEETSPLLRLPAELRNHIYRYLDLDQCTVEIISLSKTQFNALDENGVPFRHNPYPNEQIWYRLEEPADEEFSLDKPNVDTRRKRCASILGLFSLPRVCRQLRVDTLLLHYESPSFAFSDRRFNYAKAFPAFVQSLSSREKAAIRSICWPLRQAREFYASDKSHKPIELPDRAFDRELGRLPSLKHVKLRYVATDVGGVRLTGADLVEFRSLVEDTDEGDRWRIERVFRRELAMRGMRKQLSDREDVVIECVRSKRVAF